MSGENGHDGGRENVEVRPRLVVRRQTVARGKDYRAIEGAIRARLIEAIGGVTIRELADSVNLNRESVRRALRDGILSLELVVNLCARYSLSAEWVLFGGGPRESSRDAESAPERAAAAGRGLEAKREREKGREDGSDPCTCGRGEPRSEAAPIEGEATVSPSEPPAD